MQDSSFFRNVLLLAIIAVFAGSMIYGCASGPSSPTVTQQETTTIYGRITDESGAAVASVTVSAADKTATTDKNGIFFIKDVTVPKGRAVIVAKKAGYFNASRAETPGKDGTTAMILSMMNDAPVATITASIGGPVNMSGGASVNFSAGSFTDASGNPYSGKVAVSARYLDPSKNNFYSFFSGDNLAQRTDGSSTNLVSCGVLRVELKDLSGNPLQLDPSKPATLTCPKPNDPKAPSEIQLWSYNETLGMWKEEGTATLTGNNYVGTVTHFTDYNFDYCNVPNGELDFRITCNGAGIEGVVATVLGRQVITKAGGTCSIWRVAADGRQVTIDVKASDNGGVYYTNGPTSVTMVPDQVNDAGDISLSSPCPATIKGSLMCGDANVEGLVTISDGTNITYIYTKDGSFSMQAPSGKELTVDAIDPNGSPSETIIVPALSSGELRNIGVISLCASTTIDYTDITIGSNQQGEVIALSPDGSRLAVFISNPAQLSVYDTKTGNTVSTAIITKHGSYYYANGMQFSADNAKLLMRSSYDVTLLFDISSSSATEVLAMSGVNGAQLYDDGTKIIASENAVYPNPSIINVYSAADGSVITTLHPNISNLSDSIGSFGLIHDENSIVYPDDKSSLSAHVWSALSDAELRSFPITGSLYTFTASEDGLTVALSSDYKNYSCYDTKAATKLGDISVFGANGARYGNVSFTKGHAYTADEVSGAMVIRMIKISDGTSRVKLLAGSANKSINGIAASRNEQYLAAASSDKIRIWKLQ
jgi:hypothetical protein